MKGCMGERHGNPRAYPLPNLVKLVLYVRDTRGSDRFQPSQFLFHRFAPRATAFSYSVPDALSFL